MRKTLIFAALMAATTVLAQDIGEINAVCVSLKTGQTEFVAFTEEPVIKTSDGKLIVSSATDNKQIVLADIADVEKITAAYYDLPTKVGSVVDTDESIEEVYNIDGTKAAEVVPGRIYIIKTNKKTIKKTIK